MLLKPKSLIKPPLGTPVDWSHPVAQGLGPVFLLNQSPDFNLQDATMRKAPAIWTPTAASKWAQGKSGPALVGDGGFTKITSTGTINIPTDNYSIFALCQYTGSGSAYRSLARWGASGNAFLILNASTKWAFAPTGNATEYDNTATSVVVGEWAMLVGTYSSTGRTRLYKNGILFMDIASNASPPAASTLTIGATSAGSQFFQGLIEMIGWSNRVMTASDALALTTNPYCFMQAPRRLFVGPSLSTGGPFPHYTRRNMTGGMIALSGGVC